MNITLVFKIAGLGLIVGVAAQVLNKTGREEQASLVCVAGIIIAMLMLVGELSELLTSIRNAFGI